jgi:hypothetical protein
MRRGQVPSPQVPGSDRRDGRHLVMSPVRRGTLYWPVVGAEASMSSPKGAQRRRWLAARRE